MLTWVFYWSNGRNVSLCVLYRPFWSNGRNITRFRVFIQTPGCMFYSDPTGELLACVFYIDLSDPTGIMLTWVFYFLFVFCSFSVRSLFVLCSFSVRFLFVFCSFSVRFLLFWSNGSNVSLCVLYRPFWSNGHNVNMSVLFVFCSFSGHSLFDFCSFSVRYLFIFCYSDPMGAMLACVFYTDHFDPWAQMLGCVWLNVLYRHFWSRYVQIYCHKNAKR